MTGRQCASLVGLVLWFSSGLILAGPPGTWTKISSGTGSSTYQAALLRTPDGKLHVVWPRVVSQKGGYGQTAISPNGAVSGKATTVVSGWGGVHSGPRLLPDGSGLRLIFSGIKGPAGDPYSSGAMYTATSPTGSKWKLGAGALSQSNYAYASAGTGATLQADGTPVASWSFGTCFTLFWHAGLDSTIPASTPDHTYALANCCNQFSSLATDSVSGVVWLAWYSGGSTAATNGFFARAILPALGPKKKAPSSTTSGSSILPGQVVALSARKGTDGVYLAYGQGYPTIKRVALWKVGTSIVRVVPDSGGASCIVLTPGPDGRLWVIWNANGAVHAVETDKDVVGFGPVSSVQPPPNTASVYNLSGEGSLGTLDIVADVATMTGDYGFWHTQIPSD